MKKEEKIITGSNPEIIRSESHDSSKLKVFKDKCSYLYKFGHPFTLIKSGSTYELQSEYYNERAVKGKFSPNAMNFIKAVKKHIIDNKIVVKFIDKDYKGQDIRYIEVGDYAEGEVIENISLIDIRAAYWQTARNLGIIDYKLFQRGMAMNKVTRLAALGSLAKTKDIWKFDGEYLVKVKTEHSYATENIWFAICKKVSDVMQKIVKEIGDDMIFYWVDGIYVKNKPEVVLKVISIIKEANYSCSEKAINRVEFKHNSFLVYEPSLEEDNTATPKEFSYCVGKDRSKIDRYIEDHYLAEIANKIMYKPKK
jgi:hypothetical protein